MSQSPVESSLELRKDDPNLKNYQSGWRQLNELLRHGGSLSGRERNCCYLNLGTSTSPRFADVSHVSGFDIPVDGRGLALTDWDRDGDLDVWMSNRTGPRIQYLRNDSQPRHFVSLHLRGTKSNRDAIGARVEVEVEPSLGVLSRTVVAGDAYLSQSSKTLHFGLGETQRIKSVRVRWPGTREFQEITGVSLDGVYQINEGRPLAARRGSARGTGAGVADSQTKLTPRQDARNKMFVVGRLPLPPIEFLLDGTKTTIPVPGRPTLLLLWSPRCLLCVEELSEWSRRANAVRDLDLEVVAISAARDRAVDETSRELIERIQFPFSSGHVHPRGLQLIEAYLGFLQRDYPRPLGVPLGILVDRNGQAAVIYRGAVSVDEVLEDISVLQQSPEEIRNTQLPYSGRWLREVVRPEPNRFASELSEQFGIATAIDYFEQLLHIANSSPASRGRYAISKIWQAQALNALGTISLSAGRFAESADYSVRAQRILPNDFRAFANHGAALMKLGRTDEALASLNKALDFSPHRPSVLVNRATLFRQLGRQAEAIQDWETILRFNPDDEQSRLAAAALAFAIGDDQRAVTHYAEHLRRNPDSTDAAGALAWILATSPDAAVRDGNRAVALAKKWTETSQGQDYKALNALAAAWAEVGDFVQAIQAIDRAIELASKSDSRAAMAYRARRLKYSEKQPFRREVTRP